MGWNGSGSVTPLWTWVVDKVSYPNLTASRFDSYGQDFATAIQNCMAKDGQNAATADLSMGGFKLTNLATGVAATDAANVGQLSGVGVLPRSYLINGSFRWWQRHGWTGSITVTPAAAGAYIADRWYGIRDGAVANFSFTQRLSNGALSHPSSYGIKIQRVAGDTSVVPIRLGQSLDATDIAQMKADAYFAHGGTTAGRYLMFSAYFTKGANAATGGTIRLELLGNAAANANIGTTGGWVSISYSDHTVVGLSTTVAGLRYGGILTGSLALTYNSYAVRFEYTPAAGTAGADDSITMTCARLTFSYSAPPVQVAYEDDPVDLWKVFRYCQKGGGMKPDDVPGPGLGPGGLMLGVAQSNTDIVFPIRFDPPLAVTPTAGKHLFFRGPAVGGSGPVNVFIPGSIWTNISGTVGCNLSVNGAQCSLATGTGLTGGWGYNMDFTWLADGEFY